MNLRQSTSLLLLCLLTSCSGDALHSVTEPVEIRVTTGFTAGGVLSRGGGSISGGNITVDSPLPLSVVRLDQTSESVSAYLPYTDGAGIGSPLGARLEQVNSSLVMTFVNSEVYLTRNRNNKTKLIGWYPPVDDTDIIWSVDEDSKAATVSFKVNGETDIMMSNLVEGHINDRFNGDANSLVFNHLLTRICIRVGTTNDQGREVWGGLKEISIAGKAQTCEVRLPGVESTNNTHPTEITFKGSGTLPLIYKSPTDNSPIGGYDNDDHELEIPLIDDPYDRIKSAMAGYAMIAPGEVALSLTIKTGKVENGTATITPPGGGFKAGNSYSVILDFTEGKEISVSAASITKWDDGGSMDSGVIAEWPEGWDDDIDWTKPLVFDGESNCYMVPPDGQLLIPVSRAYTFAQTEHGKAASFPVLEKGEQFYAKLYWSDTEGLLTEENIIPIGTGPKGYLLVKPGDKSGNAVVAVQKKIGEGDTEEDFTTLWSWHIWVTDYEPNASNTFTNIWNTNNNGKHFVFMDRNLGATKAGRGYGAGTGLFYQWGRKDPFPTTLEAGQEQLGGGSFTAVATSETKGTVANTIKNPSEFLVANDHLCDWLAVRDNTLWGHGKATTKSIYDPCPVGWRVPSHNVAADDYASTITSPWYGFTAALGGTWSNGYSWGTNAQYPATGFRYYNNSNLFGADQNGHCWGASANDNSYGVRMDFGNGRVGESGSYRAFGFSVRCVRES